ncbi:MAG: hypothetical protein V7L20_31840 [Nostoc sp.]|uniref:hypothetical protein n=1 Tax=Nostoc sp. TaxID=1180 RepID=UPI002FFB992B
MQRINDEAVAIEPQTHSATVHLQNHQVLHTQIVVLAFGNFPPSNPRVETAEFYQSDRYVKSAWSNKALNELNSEESANNLAQEFLKQLETEGKYSQLFGVQSQQTTASTAKLL